MSNSELVGCGMSAEDARNPGSRAALRRPRARVPPRPAHRRGIRPPPGPSPFRAGGTECASLASSPMPSSDRSEGNKVGDHRDGLGSRDVGVGPARKLVQVVADASDLPGALALDGACRCGPRPRPRHRLAQQRGRRHASRSRLLPPGGVLGGRDARGDHHGAMLSHERTDDGVRGPRPRASAAPPAARQAGGSKGGAASPRQPRCSTSRVLACL